MFSKLATFGLLPLALAMPAAPTKYMVVLKPGAQIESIPSIQGVQISHNYAIGDFKGFAANLNEASVQSLRNDPSVSIT